MFIHCDETEQLNKSDLRIKVLVSYFWCVIMCEVHLGF